MRRSRDCDRHWAVRARTTPRCRVTRWRGALRSSWYTAWLMAGLGVVLAGRGAAGQQHENPSILTFLPTKDTVVVGVAALGSLETTDALVRAGRRVRAWHLDAEEGQAYLIDLASDAFDAFLYVAGPGIANLAAEEYALTDDDSGGNLNASLCFIAPTEASYHVIAAALYAETGSYELAVREGCIQQTSSSRTDQVGDPLDANPSTSEEAFDPWQAEPVGHLEYGSVHRGAFTMTTTVDEGRPVEVWTLDVEGGQRFVIDMISTDFDALLYVHTPAGWGPLEDDDGRGTGLDSRLCVLPPENTTYRVVASAVSTDEAPGSYGMVVNFDPNRVLCPDGYSTSTTYFSELVQQVILQEESDSIPVIRVGDSLSGQLTQDDWTDPMFGDSWRRWLLPGLAGTSALLELRSYEFDPTLWIVGPGLENGMIEDDDDADCNATVHIRFPETATYLVLGGGRDGVDENRGSYTLTAEAAPVAPRTVDYQACLTELPVPAERRLTIGYEAAGRLTEDDLVIDGRRVQVWSFDADAADALTIMLDSEDFDTILSIHGVGDSGEIERNDDWTWGTTDSRILFEAPLSGTYRILVSAFDDSTGSFVVRAVRRAES